MSQALRQSNIFAGEEWTVLYKAFTNIDFTSYDPPTIQAALQTYLRTNYPESFNDWIASSEYVAIIDVLSWLAGSLSFRVDINARENFLETASARESILRLAQFLSYSPRRGNSGRGLIKVTKVKTTENVIDSYGDNISNQTITWNDPNDPDWLDKFQSVINCALPVSNKLGTPSVKTSISSINTETYPLQSKANSQCVYKFIATVDAAQETFELVNTTISENGFIEKNPNQANNFDIIYRLDGKGYGSNRTGYFFFFKQGELKSQTYNIQYKQENRVIAVESKNISETDVWVQTTDDYGIQLETWDRVPGFVGENISFNSLATDIRNIYTIQTETNDSIGIRFGDGRFGNIPYGNIRVWYRTINNKQYTIKPKDMESIQVSIPYTDSTGRNQTMTFTISLQEEVTNAIGSETTEQIRYRASQVYSTQNRMVSGEDYNLFPLSTNEIIKCKAVNRIYSGQSRYLDIVDPTATYQDTILFCDDGRLSVVPKKYYTQIPLSSSVTTEALIKEKIQRIASYPAIRNMVREKSVFTLSASPTWKTNSSSSVMNGLLDGVANIPYTDQNNIKAAIQQGGSLYFEYTVGTTTIGKWVTITNTDISASTFNADVVSKKIFVSDSIPSGAKLVKVIPRYRTSFLNKVTSVYTYASEFEQLQTFVNAKKAFRLFYKPSEQSLILDDNTSTPGIWYIVDYAASIDASWIHIIDVNYISNDCWEISTAEGYNYVFTSERITRFTNTSNNKKLDGLLQTEVNDTISVIVGPGQEIVFDIVDNYRLEDGTIDNSSVIITPSVKNNFGGYIDPDAFNKVKKAYSSTVVVNETRTETSVRTIYKNVSINGVTTREYLQNAYITQNMNPMSNSTRWPRYYYATEYIARPDRDPQLGDELFVSAYRGVWSEELQKYINGTIKIGRVYNFVNGPISITTYNGVNSITTTYPYAWELAQIGDIPVGYGEANMHTRYSYSGSYYDTSLETTVTVVKEEYATQVNYKWKHYSGIDVRINPAISNIVDIFALTSEYDYNIRTWISEGMTTTIPESPDSASLKVQFKSLEDFKMFSDEIVWRPVTYKFLFGSNAASSCRCKFNVVKLPSASLSDGEVKAKIISYINEYFDVNKWDFGETFFFTELSAYIHMKMATYISTIVLVPLDDENSFGHMFQVKCDPNELFISSATVDDISIVNNLNSANMRIR